MPHDTTATKANAPSVNVVTKVEARPDIALFEHGRITFVSSENAAAHTGRTPRAIANQLTVVYPRIATDPQILGGKPHIQGTRLAVASVISAVCVHGSIQAAVADYNNQYTEEEFFEALRYARDFLTESLK